MDRKTKPQLIRMGGAKRLTQGLPIGVNELSGTGRQQHA